MLTTESGSVAAPPAAARTRSTRRALVGWLLAGFGIWMAFNTATTTFDDGLRLWMIVVGSVLCAGLAIDVTVWAMRRRPPSGS